MILKVFEEFSDGFLVLNPKGEIIFFNEVLLRLTGWRSKDILSGGRFIPHLDLANTRRAEQAILLPHPQAEPQRLRAVAFDVESESGTYTLVRLRKDNGLAAGGGERFEQLFRSIGDPMLSANLRGKITAANPAFYSLVDRPPEEPIADIAELYVYREELEDKLLRLLEADAVYNLETHLYGRERAVKRVLDSSWVTRDSRGVVTGYTSQLKDVSYLRNLEARLMISERNHALLFDTILSSIIIVDPLGRIVNWNYTAEQLYGYGREEVMGEEYDALFRSSRKRPAITAIFELVGQNQGRYLEAEVPRRRKDGSTIYTYASYSSIQNTSGETIAYSVIEKDLTERVNLEKKLKESLDRLQADAVRDHPGLRHPDRVPGQGHGQAPAAHPGIRAGAGHQPEGPAEVLRLHRRPLHRGPVPVLDPARRGQGGHLRLNTIEARQAHQRGVHPHPGPLPHGRGRPARGGQRAEAESFLTLGKEIAYYHHERWDGKGYPEGRRGEQIPLSARIVALADVYDALTSDRPYRQAMGHREAVAIIAEGRGTQFDPELVDAFLANEEVFDRIRLFQEFEEHPESIEQLLQGSIRPLADVADVADAG